MMENTKKRVVVLGATGSIGDSTLDILARNSERFEVFAVSAHKNHQKLAEICERFAPRFAVVTDETAFKNMDSNGQTQCLYGMDELNALCEHPEVDMVVAGIVGSAGMQPVIATVQAGKTLLLANKEALVVAGELVMKEAKKSGAKIIPLDSEHNAIYQCLPENYVTGETPKSLEKLILTASGGPFWNLDEQKFHNITPEQACNHPKWDMGRKISVDSATLMNKGLEVIEAHWLFNLPSSQIDVHVHPQSIVHSLVCYNDGSVIAQLGEPDMRIPISYGLGLDSRIPSGAKMLDLLESQRLEFYRPDTDKFPSLKLAREAIDQGGTAMAVLNFANEVSVESFLNHQIGFVDIAKVNDLVMNHFAPENADSVTQLMELDVAVRSYTKEVIAKL